MPKTLILRRGKTESIRRFHPWVFSGALSSYVPEPIAEGEVVRLLSKEGEFLAIGHYQMGSIALRILSFEDEDIDQDFFTRRIREAVSCRQALGISKDDQERRTDILRLVHGEGDRLPGLVVDRYGNTAVVQAHSVGMHHARHLVANALKEVCGETLRNIYYKSETTLPYKASLSEKEGYLLGGGDAQGLPRHAYENGLRFCIDWEGGQKTGFFVDQRENRALLERYAAGRRVLNMFCYTGGFSVYALRGGATSVCSVDASERAIDLTRSNVALNLPETDRRHEAYAEDAFRFLARSTAADGSEAEGVSSEKELPYDLVVLDPPAFAKHHSALRNALKGYTRLNQAVIARIPRGGILFTFSCSQAVSPQQFRLAVFTAAALARRPVRILHQLHQPADHPVSIYHPEGEYLKGLVLQID